MKLVQDEHVEALQRLRDFTAWPVEVPPNVLEDVYAVTTALARFAWPRVDDALVARLEAQVAHLKEVQRELDAMANVPDYPTLLQKAEEKFARLRIVATYPDLMLNGARRPRPHMAGREVLEILDEHLTEIPAWVEDLARDWEARKLPSVARELRAAAKRGAW